MTDRKLATVRRIVTLEPIEGADRIELATVDGWKVVVQKGLYKEGALAVYFEIDSFIPNTIAPFLTKPGHEPKEYKGVQGQRLKTIKLRGQVSQGLLIPATEVFMGQGKPWTVAEDDTVEEGFDLTEELGILKWERELPAQLVGKAKGNFPTHIVPKTDQERIQNCFRQVEKRDDTYEVTLKLDGSSMTVFRDFDEEAQTTVLRVCSRNLELKVEQENYGNSFIAMAFRLEDSIGKELPLGLVFQGELMGPGIQENREGFAEFEFFVYDVWDRVTKSYVLPELRRALVKDLGLKHIPVIAATCLAPNSVEEALALAEGPSLNAKEREGLVYKSNKDSTHSFKAISNKWLLKVGE